MSTEQQPGCIFCSLRADHRCGRCNVCGVALLFSLDGLCAWCDSARIRRERRAQQTADERAKERADLIERLRVCSGRDRVIKIDSNDSDLLLELLEREDRHG